MHGSQHDGNTTPSLAFMDHDHGKCSADALDQAEKLVKENGARFTPARRKVLEVLLESHRAMGAYDILARLVEAGFGNQPPVAYRALEFLEEHGLAHRIRRLNAYIACSHIGKNHVAAFLICRQCESVSEASSQHLRFAMFSAAQDQGFSVENSTFEAVGLCPACQGPAKA